MDEYNKACNQNIDDTSAFSSANGEHNPPIIIKAIGVGGGGNNAVDHMFKSGIEQVSFVNINTDRMTLRHSVVPNTLQIGDGLGAGNVPETARDFAEQSADEIAALFDDDTKMVFITAGMGGGTGTGAAPVVARIAKERGLLTIGIVTIPFLFEGQKKIKKAIAGADEMAKYVDALLVINNERLTEIYGDLSFLNAFGKADDTLSIAARSISEIITEHGYIDVDFNDVNTTLRNGGAAIISSGYGEGEGRVTQAIEDALKSPLLKNRDILGSKKLLFYLHFDPNAEDQFLMQESNEITDFISSINTDVDVIWGIGFDETLGNKVKMTILAAGFDVTLQAEEDDIMSRGQRGRGEKGGKQENTEESKPLEPKGTPGGKKTTATPPTSNNSPTKPNKETDVTSERIIKEYGKSFDNSNIILGINQLDDDSICDILENYPTYKRNRKIVEQVMKGNTSTFAEHTEAKPSTGTQHFEFRP
ncbi:MAG: cell division protein FtsZ [Duncaniella sp.]|nr:cell division protein FtsZ [Muribaculum sp.]MCM1255259.1 cell division protein FtsZ [Duncaniella sp.]